MAVSQDLLDILICPETKQSLTLASEEQLAALNERIRAGEVQRRSGDAVSDAISAALVREDGRVLYPIEDEIPVMLIEESIELPS